MTKKKLMKEYKKHELTAGYEYDENDVILEYDGYVCIYQPKTCGNIVFLAVKNKHRYSLWHNVKYFYVLLKEIYRVNIITIRNKRWKYLLNKLNGIQLVYENDEYCIYTRETSS